MVWLWLGCGLLTGCGGPVPGNPVGTIAGHEAVRAQDRFPENAHRLEEGTPPEPYATAVRKRVTVQESVTRHGEPLALGSMEIPADWSTVQAYAPAGVCEGWRQCVLWEAASPDGMARIALLSPRRGFEETTAGDTLPQSSIATLWLRGMDGDPDAIEAAAESIVVEATVSVSRKGWLAGGAWLSLDSDNHGIPMRELRAVDVESMHMGRRLHQVQGWPMLLLRMPAADYDANVADAIRRSLRFDPEWVPQWWLAWESRTIREQCKLGYHRGDCHVQDGPYSDYFRAGHSLGLWDIRSSHPYEDPGGHRYDAGAAPARK